MNKTSKYISQVLLVSSLLSAPILAHATEMTAEEKGLQIVKESLALDDGYKSSRVNVKMTLTDRRGTSSTREMTIQTLENNESGHKFLAHFTSPKELKGTAYLTFSNTLEEDQHWLYLPSLNRVKRISTNQASNVFAGSEFTYEDFAHEVEKHTHTFKREDTIGNANVFVVEDSSVNKYSGYKRRVLYIDKTHKFIRKIDYFDRKNELLKTLTLSNYKQYGSTLWRAKIKTMENHQSGKTTVLNFDDHQFDAKLSDKDFSSNALKRIR